MFNRGIYTYKISLQLLQARTLQTYLSSACGVDWRILRPDFTSQVELRLKSQWFIYRKAQCKIWVVQMLIGVLTST